VDVANPPNFYSSRAALVALGIATPRRLATSGVGPHERAVPAALKALTRDDAGPGPFLCRVSRHITL